MRVHIEPTSRIVELVIDGCAVPARIWEGTTDNGIGVICWVTRVAALRTDDLSELDAALAEQRQPTHDVAEWPNRMVL
jgi:hypothetical protein